MAGTPENAAKGALNVVGKIDKATGTVEVVHPDGTRAILHAGDVVYQGDTITTGADGAVGITFADNSTLALAKSGRMIIDELVYDPAAQTGQSAMSVVKGAFSYASGQIAKSAPDAATLKTPVMTIGIRGTSVAGTAASEGEENTVTLLQDADGHVGQILVNTAGGTVTLNQPNFTSFIFSFVQPPQPPVYMPAQDIQSRYGGALDNHPGNPPRPTTLPPAPPPPPSLTPPGSGGNDGTPLPNTGGSDGGDDRYVPPPAPLSPLPPTPLPPPPVPVPPVPTPPPPPPQPNNGPINTTPPPRTDPPPAQVPQQQSQSPQQSPQQPSAPEPANAAPVLSGRNVALVGKNTGTTVLGEVRATDPEGGPVTLSAPARSANGGTVELRDGLWSYVAKAGFAGIDTFVITATDANGASSQRTITVFVNANQGGSPTIHGGPMDTFRPEPGEWTSIAEGASPITVSDGEGGYVQVTIDLHAEGDSSGVCRITINGVVTEFTGTFYLVGVPGAVSAWLTTLQYKGGSGEYDFVEISVSDGFTSTPLSPFSIVVPTESTFTGAHTASPQDFAAAGNWSNGIPDDSEDAVISGRTVVSQSEQTVRKMTVKNGANMTVRNSVFTATKGVVVASSGLLTIDGATAAAALNVGNVLDDLPGSIVVNGGSVHIHSASITTPTYGIYEQNSGSTLIDAGGNEPIMTFDLDVALNGGTFTLDATAGNVNEIFGCQFVIGEEGTLVLTKANNTKTLQATFTSGLENHGVLRSEGSGSTANTIIVDPPVRISNSGTIAVLHDLTIVGSLDNERTGVVNIAAGAVLRIDDDPNLNGFIFRNDGLLCGHGTLEVGADAVLGNSEVGTVAPGDSSDETGTLTIRLDGGTINFQYGAALDMDFRGPTDHDILAFDGTAGSIQNAYLHMDIRPTTSQATWNATTEQTLVDNLESGSWFGSVEHASDSSGRAIFGVWFDDPNNCVKVRTGLFAANTTAQYIGNGDDETIVGASLLKNNINGGDGSDTIRGGAYADTLLGGAGNDILRGDEGNDTLVAGTGYDSLYGGDGNDILRVSDTNIVKAYGDGGFDVLEWSGSTGLNLLSANTATTLHSVEAIKLTGTGSVTLDTARILANTPSQDHSIYVQNGTNAVYLLGNWVASGTHSADLNGDSVNESYTAYTDSGATVYVQNAAGVNVSA